MTLFTNGFAIFPDGTQVLAPTDNLMQNAGGALSLFQTIGSSQSTSQSNAHSQPLHSIVTNTQQNGKFCFGTFCDELNRSSAKV